MTRVQNDRKDIFFTFDSIKYKAKEGDSIANALLANDIKTNRETFGKKTSRGSFCLMGVCFECLVKVDGISAVQGCKTKLLDGMEIEKDV